MVPSKKQMRSFRWSSVVARRTKLFDVFSGYADEQITPSSAEQIVEQAMKILPAASRNNTVRVSFLNLVGRTLSMTEWYNFAWQMAASCDKLKAGKSVVPWCLPQDPEWLAGEITAWEVASPINGQLAMRLRFQALNGSAAGARFYKTFTHKFLRAFIFHLGGRHVRYGPRQLLGMRLWVELRYNDYSAALTFDNFEVGSFKSSNVKLFKIRDKYCVSGFKQLNCYNCYIGLDQCKYSMQAVTTNKPVSEVKEHVVANESTDT